MSVEREILASKGWLLDEFHPVASARRSGNFKDMLGLLGVVFGDRVAGEPFDARGASQSGGCGLDELGKPCFGLRPGRVRQGPEGPLHDRGGGDDIKSGPGMDGGDREDHRIRRLGRAGDDGLGAGDDLRRGDDRVDPKVRIRGVGLRALDGDREGVGRGEQRAGSRRDGSERLIGPAVETEHFGDGWADQSVEGAVADEFFSARAAFFSGLEDEGDRVGSMFDR